MEGWSVRPLPSDLPGSGVRMEPEQIDAWLEELRRRGRQASTLQSYRRCLMLLYQALPADRMIFRGTLDIWRQELLDSGYTPRTVNVCLSAANSFLAFLGRQDCQTASMAPQVAEEPQPELTRPEYLRLLQTARALKEDRTYLLVKLFALTGLTLQELPKLTVEAVQSGSFNTVSNGAQQEIHLPACLQRELLDYAERHGIVGGTLFCTRRGRPLNRSTVSDSIRRLCRDARISEEKGNPRCLKKLCQETRASIEASVRQLVEQTWEQLLETEQFSIGWDARK